MDINDLAK